MKQTVYLIFSLTIFLFSCQSSYDTLKQGFKNPPESAKINTWWHWMDNAITREGITADLESMHEQGIKTATILNVSLMGEPDYGIPKIIFGSTEWFDMFQWALEEANRLGMTIGVHNCDGWSSSGGPWITPEMSMKQCSWNKTIVQGGAQIDTILQKPMSVSGFYKDIAILAIPTDQGSLFQKNKPKTLIKEYSLNSNVEYSLNSDVLYDGNPISMVTFKIGYSITMIFDKPFYTDKIAIHPRKDFLWSSMKSLKFQFEILGSDDGKTYRSICTIDTLTMNMTTVIPIKPTTAKYYKLIIHKFTNGDSSDKFGIAELELLSGNEIPLYSSQIPFHTVRIATTKSDNIQDAFVRTPGDVSAVPIGSLINITDKISDDDRLVWDAPEGNWAILRIGYTSTGSTNGPATKVGGGLECDKMDTAALNLHFRNFPAKLIKQAGKFTGNTFEYIFVDSWECEFQNWTANFPTEFMKRRGYDITLWLATIAGETIESPEATDGFLYDFNETISELISENYYSHFTDLCHENGLKAHAEVIYGGTGFPPIDVLKGNKYPDLPMFEFWANPSSDGFIRYSPSERPFQDMAMHASSIYGKSIFAAEAYTGYAVYSEKPWDLKLFGDRAFCSGINQLVLHSYVHQPLEKKPGMTLGVFGQAFNRHNIYWKHVSQWFRYHATVQYILQQGNVVSDILQYTGDDNYSFNDPDILNMIPLGVNRQLINHEILLQAKTRNGRIVLPNGLDYGILMLPNSPNMKWPTLQKIEKLVSEGAVVYGPKPKDIPGFVQKENIVDLFKNTVNKLWGDIDGTTVFSNPYQKGMVYWGIRINQNENSIQITPDFSSLPTKSINPLFIHKRINDLDVYYVVNQEDKEIDRECIFKVKGKTPEIWDPRYGTVVSPAIYEINETHTRIPVHMEPKGSLFFVFKNEKPFKNISKVNLAEKQIFPDLDGVNLLYVPETDILNNKITFKSRNSGDYTLINENGVSRNINVEAPKIFPIDHFSGKVRFESINKEIEIDKLFSWDTSLDNEVKYYSGDAHYDIKFDVNRDFVQGGSVFLDLGEVIVGYSVKLNGKHLGESVFPSQHFDVTGILKVTDNIIEVTVSNNYRNRIIGDFVTYGKLKNVFTTSGEVNRLKNSTLLQASGILGPMRVIRYDKAMLE